MVLGFSKTWGQASDIIDLIKRRECAIYKHLVTDNGFSFSEALIRFWSKIGEVQ